MVSTIGSLIQICISGAVLWEALLPGFLHTLLPVASCTALGGCRAASHLSLLAAVAQQFIFPPSFNLLSRSPTSVVRGSALSGGRSLLEQLGLALLRHGADAGLCWAGCGAEH